MTECTMNVEPLGEFERKFVFFALLVGLPILFSKIVLGNTLLLNTASEIVGGKENVWFVLQFPFYLVWRFSWFFVCMVVGILFTWLSYYIVYLDSSVPGVQPPSPFSPGRQSRVFDDPDTPRSSHMYTDSSSDNSASEEDGTDGNLLNSANSRITAASVTSAWVEQFSEPTVDTSANATTVGNNLPHNSYSQKVEQESLRNEALLIVTENKHSLQEDCFDLFGKLIAMKLRKLPKHQMLIAERIINDALYQAEMGNLTLSHRLIDEGKPQEFSSKS